ncbi:MAG: AZOBR_p60025 family cell surface glycopolymer formation protein [Anaerolineales bacterium]
MSKSAIIPGPAGITLLVMLLLVAWVITSEGGDPMALVQVGTQYSEGDPDGTQGYDGQFGYYIARDPNPKTVAPLIDNPPYRYQRILLPLLGRVLSFGNPAMIPWALAGIGVASHTAGTWVFVRLLEAYKVNRWYGLVYGLWAGFLLAVRLDLPEPLAYTLVGGAILLRKRNHPRAGWALYALALFAKEVTILFLAAQLLVDLWHRRWRDFFGLFAAGVVPFGVFQLWLWHTFGRPGIGSGGAMSTPFEWIPFWGLLRIGNFSVVLLLVFTLVFGPFVFYPALWGVWVSGRRWLRGQREFANAALLLNGAIIPFLPFSTIREPGGMLRLATGLVMATLLYAARYRSRRVLNYSVFWLFYNAIVVAEWVWGT